jgi:FMN phosphatase YigB (HAD superfamily)
VSLEAVTFDFWNTLAVAPQGALAERRLATVARAALEAGVDLDEEAVRGGLEEVWNRHSAAWEAGEVNSPQASAEELIALLGLEEAGHRQAVTEAFLTAGRGAEIEPAPGVGECLRGLAECGIAMAIICDVGLTPGAILRDALEREGLLRHFGAWAFSDEVGRYKPAPEMFEAALGPLGAAPERAVHVGDLLRTDVAGGRAFGMGTVRYRELNDDPPGDGLREADHVCDSHAELLALLKRWPSP